MFGMDDIGVDLGTSSVLIYGQGKGVVLREPSVVAIDRATRNILAVGEEAQRMMGRTPANIMVIRPLAEGVISDYDVAERMLRFFLRKVMGRRMMFRPRVLACVPSGVTDVEKRSVIDAMLDAGARKAQLIDEPVAAAIGAGLDIEHQYGNMVVDIGGGTTDLAILAMGQSIISVTTKVAGDRFDEAIMRYLRRKHNLMIGERSAEELKIQIGAAEIGSDSHQMEVTGRSLISGLPKSIAIHSDEIVEALDEPILALTENIQALLERTPPELAADVFERGITLTGGGALLTGLDRVLTKRTRVECKRAEDAVACVVQGTGRVLEERDRWLHLLFDNDDNPNLKR